MFEKKTIHAYEEKINVKVNSCGIFVSKQLTLRQISD